jgi:outer membrane protein OmpA-like peptidoglycan-associated protein
MLAAAMLTVSASAQKTVTTASKAGDNWYVGINAGAGTPMVKWNNGDAGFMKGFAPSFGIRAGKNLTTVFGLALDVNTYFEANEKSGMKKKTFIDGMNANIMGTFNLSNLFAGYKGEPRTFEVIALAGPGYSRSFGENHGGGINVKGALDFAFNLGAKKAWQIYIEPAAIFGQPLPQYANPFRNNLYDASKDKNKLNGLFQLNLGMNYKFGTSNGTHNFAKEQLRDQAEIDALNANINNLRAANDAKASQIAALEKDNADLKKKLADCEARPTQIVEEVKKETVLQPIVIFRQGKSTIDAAQYANIEMIAKYMKNHPEAKVLVRGYASPEGDAELNQRLSVARAEAVQTALINRYKIAADRITTEGLGATDKLSEEIDFNRVAMFVDTTK